MNQNSKDKYKNVSAFSYTTYNNQLIINFNGFEDHDDTIEFADFLFAKIKMKYWHEENLPTYH